jgi:hypothetical protein
MRTLTSDERRVILLLAAEVGSDEERGQLLIDLDHCSVKQTISDGSILVFDIDGYQRPIERGRWQYRQKDGFIVDGAMKDADGSDMDVMLLADTNHRIGEFEIVRHGIGSIIKPNWNSFKVK